MKQDKPSKSFYQSQDFHLNLAPIIDCFTVLIAFIMISTAFVSIGILDAGITAGGESSKHISPPPINITVDVKKNQTFKIHTTGKVTQEISVNDFDSLLKRLNQLKIRWPSVNGITLKADDYVDYKVVTESLEMIRKLYPAVSLGGF